MEWDPLVPQTQSQKILKRVEKSFIDQINASFKLDYGYQTMLDKLEYARRLFASTYELLEQKTFLFDDVHKTMTKKFKYTERLVTAKELLNEIDAFQFDVHKIMTEKWKSAQRLVTFAKEVVNFSEPWKEMRHLKIAYFEKEILHLSTTLNSNEHLKKIADLDRDVIRGLRYLWTIVNDLEEIINDETRDNDSVNENGHQGKRQLNGALEWVSAKCSLLAKTGIGVSVFFVGIIFFIWLPNLDCHTLRIEINFGKININSKSCNIRRRGLFS